jgi:hypothetical protein
VYPHRLPAGSSSAPLYFVDVGANDGVSLSQTLALERDLGWRGVCVEASDPHFAALVLSRPTCRCAHACLSGVANATVAFALDHTVLVDGGAKSARAALTQQLRATCVSLKESQGAPTASILTRSLSFSLSLSFSFF